MKVYVVVIWNYQLNAGGSVGVATTRKAVEKILEETSDLADKSKIIEHELIEN